MQKSLLTKRLSPAAAETLRRYLTALLSLVFFALGVTLMSRSQLGISPIQSVAYVVYNRLAEHTTLGTVVLCWNCVQVLAQWPLLGRFGWKQLVQIPLSLFLGVMVDATGAHSLAEMVTQLEQRGITVLIKGVRPEHLTLMRRLQVFSALRHRNHLFEDLAPAVEHARSHIRRIDAVRQEAVAASRPEGRANQGRLH